MSYLINPYMVEAKIETWILTAGTLSAGIYHPSGKGYKSDGWNTTGIGAIGGGNRPELDIWNGTVWANSGNNINITVDGASGCGSSTSIICAGGNYQSDVGGAGNACSSYASGTWTQKANMNQGKTRAGGMGSASSYLAVGGEIVGGSWNRTPEVQEYDLSGDSWSSGTPLPNASASGDGIMGGSCDGDSTSNGMYTGGWATDYTIAPSAYAFNGSSWTAVSVPTMTWAMASCIGGGTPTGYWCCGGQLVGGYGTGTGAVLYYNGTSWETKTSCLEADGGAGGANNGGTNPQIAGGNEVGVSGNGNWLSGQYWG